jgi:hypothetical protein
MPTRCRSSRFAPVVLLVLLSITWSGCKVRLGSRDPDEDDRVSAPVQRNKGSRRGPTATDPMNTGGLAPGSAVQVRRVLPATSSQKVPPASGDYTPLRPRGPATTCGLYLDRPEPETIYVVCEDHIERGPISKAEIADYVKGSALAAGTPVEIRRRLPIEPIPNPILNFDLVNVTATCGIYTHVNPDLIYAVCNDRVTDGPLNEDGVANTVRTWRGPVAARGGGASGAAFNPRNYWPMGGGTWKKPDGTLTY